MKKLYLNGSGSVLFDPETDKIERTPYARSAIRDVFLIKEPTQIIYDYSDKKIEVFAEPDDIVVNFYNGTFETPIVIVKSAVWVDNIKKYEEDEQRRKEEWAVKKAEEEANTECSSCDNDMSSI